jgi:hypothetical protein
MLSTKCWSADYFEGEENCHIILWGSPLNNEVDLQVDLMEDKDLWVPRLSRDYSIQIWGYVDILTI